MHIIEGEDAEPATDCRVQNKDLRVQNPDLEFDEDSKVNDDQKTFRRDAKNEAKNCELLMVTHGTSKPQVRFYTNIFAKDIMGIPKSDVSRVFTTGDSSDEGFSDSDDEQEINSEVSGIKYSLNPVIIELTYGLRVQNPDLRVEKLDSSDQNPSLKDQIPDLPDLETDNDHETFGSGGVDETKNKLLDLYQQSLMFEQMRGQNPDLEDQYLDLPDLEGNSETNDDHETFENADEDETNGEFDPFHQSQLFEIERQNQNPDLIQEDSEANVDYALEIERQLPDDLYFIQDSETNDDHETFGNAGEDDTDTTMRILSP